MANANANGSKLFSEERLDSYLVPFNANFPWALAPRLLRKNNIGPPLKILTTTTVNPFLTLWEQNRIKKTMSKLMWTLTGQQ